MEYRSKYKAEEIEAILDARNNTGEGVDSNLDVMFTGQLQTKEVEVSEDTTIKADEGFLGLKEVRVKVSGGGDGGGNVEYLDMREVSLLRDIFFAGAYVAKGVIGDNIWICAPYMFLYYMGSADNINFLAVDMNQNIAFGNGNDTLKKALLDSGYTEEQLASIPRITEEEFYTL